MLLWIKLLFLLIITKSEYCQVKNQLDIIGGNSSRLITEGSQVTITCCTREKSTGIHEDQLIWYGPNNTLIQNYFEDLSKSSNAFSLVDYSKSDRLINQIIIEKFSKKNEGSYQCSYDKPANKLKNTVYLKLRPNIIIDSDLSKSSGKNSTPSLTASTKTKMIEMSNSDRISCKIDPNYVKEAKIKWFYNGRLLDDYDDIGLYNLKFTDEKQTILFENAQLMNEGVYLCKVEIKNPVPWHGEEESFSNKGYIIGDKLIQYQPFNVIVYSRPDIFPGSPRNIQPDIKERFYQNILSSGDNKVFQPEDIVTSEGDDMTLECATNGYPSPTIYWYRGSSINHKIRFKNNNDIDTEPLDHELWNLVKNYGFNSNIVRRNLGNLIAEGDRLAHENDFFHQGIDHNSTTGFGNSNSPIYGSRSEKGRFAVFAGKKSTGNANKLTVSQLTIRRVASTDATIYTCIAILNMTEIDHMQPYYAISSIFPKVVFKPKFIKENTNLIYTEYPNQDITLTCEAFGGLHGPQGLRVFFVRGPGLERAYQEDQLETYLRQCQNGKGDDRIEFITESASNYELKTAPQLKNPYITTASLKISHLKPDDNAHYACFAMTSPFFTAAFPTKNFPLGRVTVLFKPIISKTRENPEIVFATMSDSAVLSCKATGKPNPEWSWTLPNGGSDKHSEKIQYIDGEFSVSNLTASNTHPLKNAFGEYTCRAKNSLGEDVKTMRLRLAYHPGQPKLIDCAKDSVRKIVCVSPPDDAGGFPIMYYDVRVKYNENGPYFKKNEERPDIREIDFSYENSENYDYLSVSISAVTKFGNGMSARLDIDKSNLEREAPELMLINNNYPTQTTYKLEWQLKNPKKTVVKTYIIMCQPKHLFSEPDEDSQNTRAKVAETNPSNNTYSYQFSNLNPGTEYEGKLYAETEPSHFPGSNIYEFRFKTPYSMSSHRGQVVTGTYQRGQMYPFTSTLNINEGSRISYSKCILTISYSVILALLFSSH